MQTFLKHSFAQVVDNYRADLQYNFGYYFNVCAKIVAIILMLSVATLMLSFNMQHLNLIEDLVFIKYVYISLLLKQIMLIAQQKDSAAALKSSNFSNIKMEIYWMTVLAGLLLAGFCHMLTKDILILDCIDLLIIGYALLVILVKLNNHYGLKMTTKQLLGLSVFLVIIFDSLLNELLYLCKQIGGIYQTEDLFNYEVLLAFIVMVFGLTLLTPLFIRLVLGIYKHASTND